MKNGYKFIPMSILFFQLIFESFKRNKKWNLKIVESNKDFFRKNENFFLYYSKKNNYPGNLKHSIFYNDKFHTLYHKANKMRNYKMNK